MSGVELHNARRINAICCDFESSWQAGRRPQIESVVAQAEPEDRALLLAELIALEFELRLAAGEPVLLSEYQERFAAEEPAVTAAVSRISTADAGQAVRSPREQFEATLEADRIQLGEPVGAGGMGVVVRAHDAWLDRNLAVKVLADGLQTGRHAVERFIREAQICARLQHPGVIPVYEMGWQGERPYFAMKLVTGQSLAELLAARRDPGDDLPRWLEIFERICETVAYAHDQAVVHRDLKPANVMLGSFGEVYVIDWGLAKWLPDVQIARPPEEAAAEDRYLPPAKELPLEEDRLGKSLLGLVVGTPAYMSPEQAKGLNESIDRRADVFSLGAMLCEILTGAPPYADDGQTRLERAREGELAEALARLKACSADPELVALARECLALERADRPPDATHVWKRLKTFSRGVQDKLRKIELERAAAAARDQERRRRRRVFLALSASLLVLVGILAGGAIWTARREAARQRDETAHREQMQRRLAETLNEVDELFSGAPEDWRRDLPRRTRIRELAHRAETLAESGLAEPLDFERVAALRERILAEDADGRLLNRLEEIRLERAKVNPRTNRFASGRTRLMYQKAFADYGLDLREIDAEQAVARICRRPPYVVEACVFAMENWRSLYKSNVPLREWIDTVLDGIDQNPWRCSVRRALREKDWPAVGELLRAAKDEPHSADVVNVVAFHLMDASQFELALQFLRDARLRHLDDYWINQYLAVVYFRLPEPQLEESVRFFTVALAIRQTAAGYSNLGVALKFLGRNREAEQAFRSAIRLQPDYVQAHVSLSGALEGLGQTAEAAEVRKRAEELQQTGRKRRGAGN